MIGRLVMTHPELAVLMEDKSREETDERLKGGLTSWRSLKQRQQQLQKLVTEDIPKNSRDIAVARSYGDLRENFEYKTAKEQQGILLHRQAETETELAAIKGTDFSGMPCAVAGIGTRVVLRHADGATQQFYVLGEWDQDTERGIISCGSKMGKVLGGHKPGDVVVVPGESGDVTITIAEVGGLPDEIIAWAKGVE
jgi:transcription elongation GreA/GreB family factor